MHIFLAINCLMSLILTFKCYSSNFLMAYSQLYMALCLLVSLSVGVSHFYFFSPLSASKENKANRHTSRAHNTDTPHTDF